MQREGDSSGETVAERVTRVIEENGFLPPAFEMIPRLLRLLDDPESNSEALAELIRLDAGLTANVLHVANSARYSGAERTETLAQAIMRIGLREIYRTLIKIIASPILSAVEQPSFAKLELWRHSMATAVGAQVLAREGGENEEVAFTTGLLHDLGKLAVGQALGQGYFVAIDEAQETGEALWRVERRLFGTDHAEAGGKILKRWNLPEQMVSAVAFHHEPSRAPKEHGRLAGMIYAANVLSYRIHGGYGTPEYAIHPDAAALRLGNVTEEELKGCEDQVAMMAQGEQARVR